MSEIGVGEYVRTDKGKITTIIGIDEFTEEDGTTFYETTENPGYMDLHSKNIVKHSHNILDLTGTDDIVILEYYVAKYKQRITRRFEVFRHNNLISFNNIHCNFLYDLNKKEFVDGKGYNVKIKKILTKEQFAQNVYEMEE